MCIKPDGGFLLWMKLFPATPKLCVWKYYIGAKSILVSLNNIYDKHKDYKYSWCSAELYEDSLFNGGVS